MSRMLLVAAVMAGLGFVIGLAVNTRASSDAVASARPDAGRAEDAASSDVHASAPPRAWRRSGSELVRPLMGCEPRVDGGLEPLRAPVQAVIDAARARGTVERVGVFVQALPSGRSLEIEGGFFSPASMGKVLVLMALLRAEEGRHGTLDTPVYYPDRLRKNDGQSIRPGPEVTPGRSWTLSQLAHAMIVESDNNALWLIRDNLEPSLLERVSLDLDWRERVFRAGSESLLGTTPRVIGRTFGALFDATYLGEGTSDMALRLLAQTRMRDGLAAGVPPGVVVSHKFGEWLTTSDDGSSTSQFHDCGIVYAPGRPYVACVMTLGPTAFQRPLIELVAEISRVLWSGLAALPVDR